mgnify:CR=1 FL=1
MMKFISGLCMSQGGGVNAICITRYSLTLTVMFDADREYIYSHIITTGHHKCVPTCNILLIDISPFHICQYDICLKLQGGFKYINPVCVLLCGRYSLFFSLYIVISATNVNQRWRLAMWGEWKLYPQPEYTHTRPPFYSAQWHYGFLNV